MKILFISRAFPPIVGGIENQNYELSVWLPKIAEVKTIANKRGHAFLPFFAPYALLIALWRAHSYDIILLGDGTLGLIGWLLKKITQKPVVSIVHGLDINYNSKSLGVWYEKILINLYQSLWVKQFLPSLDGLIAVGNETIRAGVARGIPENKFTFIPNGVDTKKFFASHIREELEKIVDISLEGKFVLLTSGRLAKRKGVAWFIRNVIPKLPENVLYIVAGDGADRENIKRAIEETKSFKRVKILGYVSDEARDIFFNTADLFVQPNIKIEGDMEGFGISVIEAASCGLPVVASRLEGLQDAIKNNKNGYLVETENAEEYTSIITKLMNDREHLKNFSRQARQYTIDHYAWENIAKLYLNTLEKIAKMRDN